MKTETQTERIARISSQINELQADLHRVPAESPRRNHPWYTDRVREIEWLKQVLKRIES